MVVVGWTQKMIEGTNNIGNQKDIGGHMYTNVGWDTTLSHSQIPIKDNNTWQK